MEVHPDGSVTVLTGTSPHGQGHATAWAMLASDQLGIPIEKITVKHGDTDLVPRGGGTMGSRSLQTGGVAVHQASVELIDLAKQRAADLLEAGVDDLELDPANAAITVKGVPGAKSVTLAELAAAEPLKVDTTWDGKKPTFPFGSHVCVVEVDTESGKVTVEKIVAVDDAGPILNPLLCDGQRHGGIAQGIAQALLEEVVYDEEGQPADRHLRRLRHPVGGRAPQLRPGRDDDPDPGQPDGLQGHRRGRDDRLHPRDPERGHRRPVPPRRHAHRHAPDPDAGLGSHPGGLQVKVEITVNGEPTSADVEPRQLLAHYLRETVGLKATNIGCDTTSCGACTVLLDGDAVKSCTVLSVQADQQSVTTMEGLDGASEGRPEHPVTAAFRSEHGLQCGFCTPGMVMSAVSLISHDDDLDERKVREGLEGNLCRCTGYHNIVRAVLVAAGKDPDAAQKAEAESDALRTAPGFSRGESAEEARA